MLSTNRKYWEENYPVIALNDPPLDSPSVIDTYYLEIQGLEDTPLDEFAEYTEGQLTRYRSRK